jgi:hypothetical protein
MIRYALVCDNGHAFESWFNASADYDVQVKRGLVACPECNSPKVSKAIMAPAIASRREIALMPAEVSAGTPTSAEAGEVVLVDERARALRAMVRQLHAHVVANTEDVGASFPEEARKIHYGETETRSIRGRASMEEASAMLEEGISFHPLPIVPDDRN